MTISDAITMVDALRPNQYSKDMKIRWLSRLDGMIWQEVIRTHEGGAETFDGYSSEELESKEMLVAAPYDEDVYNNYLQAMIDRENGEAGKYSQSITLFNAAFVRWRNWYNREHMAKDAGTFRF
jgi:hypothetical protein